ncbi:MAG: murein biosynthesis integral membrane protein MurJ [Candidatus Omnitrophica bacterium]|nr:murein biosynthesis integral membrane protein MurJ [Candidatus Omnitrophota bacterium]MCM8803201.1 murein biosynthesis integral membrane protein MurJ [Candidatus Omnitrophota bacterium]
MSKKIFKAVSLLAIGTIISRIFGLFREIVSANFFGTTKIYDAFLLAFMIPNFFRGLLAEGALSSSFIPVFTEYMSDHEKKKDLKKIVDITFTLSLIFTFSLFLIFFILSEIGIKFLKFESKWYYVFLLLKFTFPYLIFISFSALYTGILNSYKSFFLPSISPVVLDFFWIFSLFSLSHIFGNTPEERIFSLCIGVILGGIGQYFLLIPFARKLSYHPKINFNFSHPAIKKMGFLFLPMIVGVAVGPINLLVDYSLANLLSDGMVSGLWYATRLYQLPLGIFGISISNAVLPWLSENFSKKEFDKFKENLYYAFKILFFTIIPSTFFLILLNQEIITFLFKRGVFDLKSVKLTAYPLFFYSFGLIFYGGISIMTRCFYAFNDTRTPVKIAVFSIGTNFILDIILMKFLAHGGIALSTSLVGLINFFLLFYFFNRKYLKLDYKRILKNFGMSFVSLIPVLIFWAIFRCFYIAKVKLSIFLFLSIVGGFILYFFSYRFFNKIMEKEEL